MPYPYVTTVRERPFFYIVYCQKPKLNKSNSSWHKLSWSNIYFLKKKKNNYSVEANAVEANAVEANANAVDIKIKCKGPYPITEAEKQSANYLHTSFIIYNALKKTYIHEQRQTEYALDVVHNLITWARNHIKWIGNMLPSIPEESAQYAAALARNETDAATPARNETDAAICIDNAPAAWSFYEHNVISYEQETIDFNVEIGNIANMVCKIIKAYGADFEAIAELAKGITINIGIGMRRQKAANEILKEIINPANHTSTYLLVKIDKKMRGKKISLSGFCKHNINAAFFIIDVSLIQPKNAAAKKICDELMDRKIQNKIKYLKQHTIEYDSIVKRHTIYTSEKYVPGMYTHGAIPLGVTPPHDRWSTSV